MNRKFSLVRSDQSSNFKLIICKQFLVFLSCLWIQSLSSLVMYISIYPVIPILAVRPLTVLLSLTHLYLREVKSIQVCEMLEKSPASNYKLSISVPYSSQYQLVFMFCNQYHEWRGIALSDLEGKLGFQRRMNVYIIKHMIIYCIQVDYQSLSKSRK